MRGHLDVAPEFLALVHSALPSAVRIVGSTESEGAVTLILEGDDVPAKCRMIVCDEGLTRTVTLEAA